ncbi:MAG: nicotinate-nucleotide adenylyltransferase [Proteobacteria bacterium]|nr:nicotinate-nucleotide adenylyltransferase [Pseudomonadota bacterium]
MNRPGAPAGGPGPRPQGDGRGGRVGLLGGSFNPAHDGHRHLSLLALSRLALDEVWWLVSPQNPLKPSRGMAPLAQRLARARRVAAHPRIRVTDLEARLGTRYTADTLAELRRRFPRRRFVWLMGADNLAQIVRWRRWRRVFRLAPVAILARPQYASNPLATRAARRWAAYRVPEARAAELAAKPPPAWTFITGPTHPASATRIREREAAAGRAEGNRGSAPGERRRR